VDDNAGAGYGKRKRRGTAHAARGSGDQSGLIAKWFFPEDFHDGGLLFAQANRLGIAGRYRFLAYRWATIGLLKRLVCLIYASKIWISLWSSDICGISWRLPRKAA